MSNTLARTGEFLGSNIEFFTCYTLVDITDTGVYDPAAGTQYEQAQNLNMLLQAISLGSQPTLSSVEKLIAVDSGDFSFGTSYTGLQTVWVLRFASERMGSITVNSLVRDINGLPAYVGLDDTANIANGVFETANAVSKNTYFVRNDNL
jgi:hypothetical protein